MAEWPKVSIVMLSYNRKNDVAEGLAQILKIDYPDQEVIVVDNGSKDNTAQMIGEKFPTVRVLDLKDNIGVAAYNRGFTAATGEFIVILDDDSFPEHQSIRKMVRAFSGNDHLGVVAFDVRHYNDWVRSLDQGSISSVREGAIASRYQMAFNGAGVGIRKKVLDAVGGYPEEFFLYWNEQDLSLRILQAGYSIESHPDIISYHKLSPKNRESDRAPFFYTRNLFWLIWKYFPAGRLLKDTLKLIFLCAFHSLEQRTSVYLRAFIRAAWEVKRIRRHPVRPEIIRKLRLTYKLAFIYFR